MLERNLYMVLKHLTSCVFLKCELLQIQLQASNKSEKICIAAFSQFTFGVLRKFVLMYIYKVYFNLNFDFFYREVEIKEETLECWRLFYKLDINSGKFTNIIRNIFSNNFWLLKIKHIENFGKKNQCLYRILETINVYQSETAKKQLKKGIKKRIKDHPSEELLNQMLWLWQIVWLLINWILVEHSFTISAFIRSLI